MRRYGLFENEFFRHSDTVSFEYRKTGGHDFAVYHDFVFVVDFQGVSGKPSQILNENGAFFVECAFLASEGIEFITLPFMC